MSLRITRWTNPAARFPLAAGLVFFLLTGCGPLEPLPQPPFGGQLVTRATLLVSFGPERSEVRAFKVGERSAVETIPQDSAMSGYAYVDASGDLILAPALAGAPLLLYHPAQTRSPIRIEQPRGFGALAMIQPRGGPLFVASGGQQNALLLTVDLRTHRLVHRIDLAKAMTPTALSADRSGNVLVALCCRNNGSVVLLLKRPYQTAVQWSEISGDVVSMYCDSRDVTFLAVADKHHGSSVFYRLPGKDEAFHRVPIQVHSLQPSMAVSDDGSIYILDGRDLLRVSAPYTAATVWRTSFPLDTQTQVLDMIALGRSIFVLLARGATLGHEAEQQFAIWQFDRVDDRVTWSTGMMDDPGQFPGEPPGGMVARL